VNSRVENGKDNVIQHFMFLLEWCHVLKIEITLTFYWIF